MRRPIVLQVLLFAGLALTALAQSTPPAANPALSDPALSPDGSQLAFCAEGAIWTAPAGGGTARLLIASSATDSRPLYSPDGKWLAFESTRTGNGDIYLFELATGRLRRLTWDDGTDSLDTWSPDSQWVYFSSSSHNVGGMQDIYRVRASGGTPLAVTHGDYVTQYDAAAAPDGSLTVVTLGEMGFSQWWRDGHAHIDNTEFWRVTPTPKDDTYTRILPTDNAKNLWPMWAPDGKSLYFMSDRSGAENLFASAASGATPRAMTQFTNGRLLWPTIAANGSAIVFERDFGVWMLDLKHHRPAAPVQLTLLGAPPTPAPEHLAIANASEMAVSPDGKKIAFTAHGEVFAAGADQGGNAIRVTHTGANQFDLHWSPDNRHLAYVSDRDGHDHIYEYDFLTNSEKQLTTGDQEDNQITFSPDGKLIAYQHGITDANLIDVASGQIRTLVTGYFDDLPPLGGGGEFAWSPDSKYLAFLNHVDSQFPNAYVISLAAGDKPQQASFLSNTNSGALAWSPNGKFLLLQTGQRTEPTRIARVDLVPQLPLFREDTFHDLFINQLPRGRGGRGAAAEPAPVNTPAPVYTNIERRSSLLPMLGANNPVISPDGKWLAYTHSETGRGGNIYLMPLEERADAAGGRGAGAAGSAPRQLTSTTVANRNLQFTADSKEIFYLAGGRIEHVAVTGGQPHAVNVTASLDVNFNQEKEEMFAQAWRALNDVYMNPTFNGVDWTAVRTKYAPKVAASRTPDDLRRVLVEMIGEMNSSHSGVGAPAGDRRVSTGHLGLVFDRPQYESTGRLCVTQVIPLSPAALGGARLGDCLVSVDGTAISGATNLDQVLDDTIGRKIEVVVSREGANTPLAIKPIAAAAAKNLIYDAWVEHNRQLVDKLSDGRLGYIHMAAMGQPDLDKLYIDLDSTAFGKQGVVVDVRNNNGGFVNAYALDVLTRHPYLTMIPRGFPQGPARVALGQRALEKPTVLVTNQNSLSDSEDFTEGYEAMHLGKVVGLPTAGWIIFTSATTLIDGSSVRLPTTRILDHNGKDMERHPRPVDVEAADPLGYWQSGGDPQLAAAVKTLLAQLPPAAGGAKIAPAANGGTGNPR